VFLRLTESADAAREQPAADSTRRSSRGRRGRGAK
jgi:hypothetical protein